MVKRNRLNRLIWDNEYLLDQLELQVKNHIKSRPIKTVYSYTGVMQRKNWYLKLNKLKKNHKTVKSTIEHLKK